MTNNDTVDIVNSNGAAGTTTTTGARATAGGGALVLIGGTGGLGKEIAKGLVTAKGFDSKRALVRGDLTKGRDLEALGWELVLITDDWTATLETALVGARVVVSALSGGDTTTLETAVIAVAKKVGTVQLFVPSQFGVDTRRWGTSFPFIAGKKIVVDAAKAAGLPTLQVVNGCFSDMIFDFIAEPANGKALIIGDGATTTTKKMSWTKRSDIGYVLAKALEEKTYEAGKDNTLSIAGDTMTLKDALVLLEKALGKPLTIEMIDPAEALVMEQELLKKGMEGDMGAFFGAFKYHLVGEPARGNDGCDVSAEAKSYGVPLATLEQVLMEVYGGGTK